MENENKYQASQQGTGSAENTGQNRDRQQNETARVSESNKQNIANEIGEEPDKVSSIQELGGMSGRDDESGGSGDRMEIQSTGQATE